MKHLTLLLLVIFLGSCTPQEGESNSIEPRSMKAPPLRNGLQTQVDEKTGVKREISYVEGVKQGPATSYFKNGKVWREAFYQNNKLHGSSMTYDNTGAITRSVEYQEGVLHGEFAEYYKSGNKKLAVQYENGNPIPGLYRMDVRGEVIPEPKISFRKYQPENMTNLFRVQFELSEKLKDTKFYATPPDINFLELALTDKIGYQMRDVPGKKGQFYIDHYVEPGYFLTNDILVYAEFSVSSGKKACVKKSVHYALENY